MNFHKPGKDEANVLSWVVTIVMLSSFWPLGLFLLFSKLNHRDFIATFISSLFDRTEARRRDSAARRDAAQNYMHTPNSSSQSRASQAEQAWQAPPPYSEQQAPQQESAQANPGAAPLKKLVIKDRIDTWVDRTMLENALELKVKDCISLRIAEDVPPELLMEKLRIHDCVTVHCAAAQRGAVEFVSKDVVFIRDNGEKAAGHAFSGNLHVFNGQGNAWDKDKEKEKDKDKDKDKAKQSGKKKDGINRVSRGRFWLIGGGLLFSGFAFFRLFDLVNMLTSASINATAMIWNAIQWVAILLVGAGLLVSDRIKVKKEQEYQNCVKVVGDRASVDLNALAAATGIKPRKLEKALDDMVDRGYFGTAAYYDKARDQLIIDPAKVEAQIRPEPVPDLDNKDKFDLLLLELDRTAESILEPQMRAKALQIRGLTAAIFDAVRDDADKQAQIGSFMNYYVPTTLKLLSSYADFEAQGFQGENLSKSKERIEGAADTIIAAYQKQLDSLFLTDTMDVDSDIDVLETMLRRDGLAGSDFSQTGTSN